MRAAAAGTFATVQSLVLALGLSQIAISQEDPEIRAHPSEAVDAAPLAAASEGADPGFSGPANDPLYELISAGTDLSVAEADALLKDAYDAYPTPTTRSRAFALAADAASKADRHELALAWIDWAIREAEEAPDSALLLAERLEQAIGVALAAGSPVLARDYARRAGAYAAGWSDGSARRGVRYEPLALECPDVIDDAYVRLRAVAHRVGEGLLATPAAQCDYSPIAADGPGFTVYAVRTRMDAEERITEVVEQGLNPEEVEERRTIARRLTGLLTVVEPLFLGEDRGFLGYAQHTRAGIDDVASYAYAAMARDGVFYVGAGAGAVWDWPPEALGARAVAGLRGVLPES